MPVPVPVYFKPPAHPVIKSHRSRAEDDDYVRHSVFQHLTNSLPQPPTGPPPAFASREEWISSLPSWRRNKPRRIWEEDIRACDSGKQGFQEGLTVAGNAAVIKGAPAQAGIPPISTLLASVDRLNTHMPQSVEEDADDEMSPVDSVVGWQGEDVAQFSDDEDMNVDLVSDSGSIEYVARQARAVDDVDANTAYTRRYERGAFSPVYEDDNDPASSPAGPNTPFADYVDRAVASQSAPIGAVPHVQYGYPEEYCNAQCYQCQQYVPPQQVVHQAPPVPEPVVTPTASIAYRKLAEPLADWVATFVWKVCTTGMSLPSKYQPQVFHRQYSSQHPAHLTQSIHAMLLSTLLQPSAVFLALFYIVRLPVFFGPVDLGFEHEHLREKRFRVELLGELHPMLDRDSVESFAPFRLVLLGCMLANKWLDDHTFSNKTWHTISNIPVLSLNKLESLALDLFGHDLSISPREWAHWLGQLQTYHKSLSSPEHPQPISRPSTSPHNIVRRAIDDLIDVTGKAENHYVNGTPEPMFYGLEEHKRDTPSFQMPEQDVDVLEIDLDEDGPLREEYMPKRRIGGAAHTQPSHSSERLVHVDKSLPPPAKWSPAADEPIFRYNARSQQYVAPQPVTHGHVAAASGPAPAPYHQALDMSRRIWPADEQRARQSYAAAPAPVFTAPHAVYSSYDYPYPPHAAPSAHSRAQSLSYGPPVVGQPHGHYRSYSQSRYDGDMPYTHSRHPLPPPQAPWAAPPYNRALFPPLYDSYLYDFRSRPLVKV
ncbi:hypothetical protein PHLGIDRAFT_433361 [Phlebiopsis gigantea 11061_1 CR5-6]|uniref:Cyclin N-terminal domain-containing protein n=1 Tax=Phlebiopsis gigantea (strain 11061_1 CR5-6) TaxID=745531 RepID=A0A0C3PKU9_PHLG1|nr:hypothetical protein PHLGIDRAFT_433361 [Phlebiopsis gigantea 11061_1 CR5-6]